MSKRRSEWFSFSLLAAVFLAGWVWVMWLIDQLVERITA